MIAEEDVTFFQALERRRRDNERRALAEACRQREDRLSARDDDGASDEAGTEQQQQQQQDEAERPGGLDSSARAGRRGSARSVSSLQEAAEVVVAQALRVAEAPGEAAEIVIATLESIVGKPSVTEQATQCTPPSDPLVTTGSQSAQHQASPPASDAPEHDDIQNSPEPEWVESPVGHSVEEEEDVGGSGPPAPQRRRSQEAAARASSLQQPPAVQAGAQQPLPGDLRAERRGSLPAVARPQAAAYPYQAPPLQPHAQHYQIHQHHLYHQQHQQHQQQQHHEHHLYHQQHQQHQQQQHHQYHQYHDHQHHHHNQHHHYQHHQFHQYHQHHPHPYPYQQSSPYHSAAAPPPPFPPPHHLHNPPWPAAPAWYPPAAAQHPVPAPQTPPVAAADASAAEGAAANEPAAKRVHAARRDKAADTLPCRVASAVATARESVRALENEAAGTGEKAVEEKIAWVVGDGVGNGATADELYARFKASLGVIESLDDAIVRVDDLQKEVVTAAASEQVHRLQDVLDGLEKRQKELHVTVGKQAIATMVQQHSVQAVLSQAHAHSAHQPPADLPQPPTPQHRQKPHVKHSSPPRLRSLTHAQPAHTHLGLSSASYSVSNFGATAGVPHAAQPARHDGYRREDEGREHPEGNRVLVVRETIAEEAPSKYYWRRVSRGARRSKRDPGGFKSLVQEKRGADRSPKRRQHEQQQLLRQQQLPPAGLKPASPPGNPSLSSTEPSEASDSKILDDGTDTYTEQYTDTYESAPDDSGSDTDKVVPLVTSDLYF